MKNLECIDNIQYHLYTISNDDFEISVSDYGATLFNYKYHDIDIVMGLIMLMVISMMSNT